MISMKCVVQGCRYQPRNDRWKDQTSIQVREGKHRLAMGVRVYPGAKGCGGEPARVASCTHRNRWASDSVACPSSAVFHFKQHISPIWFVFADDAQWHERDLHDRGLSCMILRVLSLQFDARLRAGTAGFANVSVLPCHLERLCAGCGV